MNEPRLDVAGYPDVIMTHSFETLDDSREREFCRPNDQVLLALARDERVRRLAVVDPWRSLPVDVVKRRPLRVIEPATVAGRQVVRVRPRRLRRGDETSVTRLARSYREYGRVIERALGLREPATLVTFNPFVAAWAESRWFARRVYFGLDDWSAHPDYRRLHPAVRAAYGRLVHSSDAVLVVSQELANRLAPTRAVVVPNGVDSISWESERPYPQGLSLPPAPYAVYAGTIDDRIDPDLLRIIAQHPGLTGVVLVGPVFDRAVARRLGEIPRVRFTGRLRQEELIAVIQHGGVAVLPHVVSGLTTAMSPLKLYEYLAGGLAVVATDLPPVRGHGDRVHLCGSAEEWNAAISAAVGQGKESGRAKASTLRAISWEERLRPVLDIVVGRDDGVPRRRRVQ